MDKSKNEAYSETEPLFQRRGDSLLWHSDPKGAYGLGLDLAKAPTEAQLLAVQAIGAAQGGQTSPESRPHLAQRRQNRGRGGERWETFSETVKALRSSRGAEVQLDLERIIQK